jgi:hypothetical protein
MFWGYDELGFFSQFLPNHASITEKIKDTIAIPDVAMRA